METAQHTPDVEQPDTQEQPDTKEQPGTQERSGGAPYRMTVEHERLPDGRSIHYYAAGDTRQP